MITIYVHRLCADTQSVHRKEDLGWVVETPARSRSPLRVKKWTQLNFPTQTSDLDAGDVAKPTSSRCPKPPLTLAFDIHPCPPDRLLPGEVTDPRFGRMLPAGNIASPAARRCRD